MDCMKLLLNSFVQICSEKKIKTFYIFSQAYCVDKLLRK